MGSGSIHIGVEVLTRVVFVSCPLVTVIGLLSLNKF